MHTAALVLAGIACALHVLFFVMESLLFMKIHKRFHSTREQAEAQKLWAYNQGFYNLFLAAGGFAGIWLVASGNAAAGHALVVFACLFMVGAALVLIATDRRMARAALVQGLAPAIALGLLFAA